ncbi:MAG: hypothetical protein KDC05_05035 [Bacteroidales bacterium]|nr:hypothetical protein [Bacteroidales bacterium]
MKNKIIQFGMVILIFTIIFSGCKKGEDDPFFSFRSRNARIVGEWIINTMSSTSNTFTTQTISNNVNANKVYTENTFNREITISGTNKTERITDRTVTNQTYTDIEFGDTSYIYPVVIAQTLDEEIITNRYRYELDLEINKDGTFSASVSETLLSTNIMRRHKTADGFELIDPPFDTAYVNQNTNVETMEGEWLWADSDKTKVIIDAGPMHGNITRLAHDEVNIDEADSYTENKTEYEEDDFPTYLDPQNSSADTTGVRTLLTETRISTSNMQNWQPK